MFVNNKTKVLDIPTIGTVLLEKSNRAKHINISIKTTGKIRAAVPLGVSFKTAETFVYSRIDWIRKHLSNTSKTRNKLKEVNMKYARAQLKRRIDQLCEKYNFKVLRKYSLFQDTPYNILLSICKINIFQIIKATLLIIRSLFQTLLRGPNHSSSFLVICKKK